MSGIAASMQKAQFVVTNPTRFAVALAYDPATVRTERFGPTGGSS